MPKLNWVLFALLVALILAIIVGLLFGAQQLSFTQLVDALLTSRPTADYNLLLHIRLPRVLMSVLVGAILALCGAALQGLFRNPLADPSIIGISSGAAMTAALSIVVIQPFIAFNSILGISTLSVLTFLGAAISSTVLYVIATNKGKSNVAYMLLTGIAINAITGAVTGILSFVSTESQLRSLTFWTMGSLAGANFNAVFIVAIALAIALLLILPVHKAFNALALGEHEAALLGINTQQLTNRVLLATSLAVGVAVSFTGIIGFVGLIVPHLLRILGITNHKYLLPASALGGALLLAITDLLSRTIVLPAELPIGIVTALLGAPAFIFLLKKQINQSNANS